MDKIAALKKTALFGSLAPGELIALAACTVERRLRKDETLFLAGEAIQGLYVIVLGSVRAYRENPDGREQVIHVERSGATIGELPLFDDQPTPSSVAAEEPTEVLFLPREDVKRCMLAHPSIALSALKVLAGRLRKTSALVESLSLKEVDQRLAAYLLHEALARGVKRKEGMAVQVPTNPQIAARVGSVREVVSRAMAKLQQEGLVTPLDRGRWLLPNLNALKRRAEGTEKS